MQKMFYYDTAMGKIGIAENGTGITRVFLQYKEPPKQFEICETPLLKMAAGELLAYIDGKRKSFDLPFAMQGTDFEKKVWNALLTIPYGQTRTYAQIAEQTGSPRACRAVGRANGKNPVPIFVPCHRVIGKDGTLTGYSGGLAIKERLLQIENITYKKT